MRKSLRGRLQAWYALVLACVVGGFAGMLYVQMRAARFQEIDARLESSAHYLDALLRRFPPHELTGAEAPASAPPRPPRQPPESSEEEPRRRPRPPPPPPPPHDPQRILDELELPGGSARAEEEEPTYFAIWRPNGSLVKARRFPSDLEMPQGPMPDAPPTPHVHARGEYREAALRGPADTVILVGQSVAREQAGLRDFAWRLAGAAGVVLLVGLIGGWLVSARILQPIAAIATTASSISAANLSGRIDAASVDRELSDLAGVLNATFDRLQTAIEQQVRFTADASHELRTPLSVIRSQAELALIRPREPEEYRESLTACLRAAERMTALVEGLLTLARADAGKLELRREIVNLEALVEENLALIRPLADARKLQIVTKLKACTVQGDPLRLGQVITNLLTNAVNYNREGGEISVRLATASKEVVLSVQDTGWGIPVDDRPHLFERFYRVDKSRSRISATSTGGHGLGLAICKSIIEAHGGTIGFETETAMGSTFWVRLPALSRDPTQTMFIRRRS